MIFFLPVLVIFLNQLNLSLGSVQCNLGLKLYSVESGKAVCAPFGHYGCTESCEWNTTCTKTSHFLAFKGRRTYVTGFILTENNFLLQCCASLGTIIQMNRRREPLCVWTSWVNSVEMMGSLRMDPPLSKNEYIRDIMMERIPKSGRVKLRLQICKFLMQRTNCEKEKMAAEERHHYSLLLLRLSRIQLLQNSTTSLSKSASEILNSATRSRPSSALFSVVSRIDEKREIGGLLSGTAGGLSSREDFLKTSGFQSLQNFDITTVGPQLNTAHWDDQSGIPKSKTNNAPPPGVLDSSSFNFDIVPVTVNPANQQRIQIIKKPQILNSKRLRTNATREFVTRYVKAKDQSPFDRKINFDESPLKNSLQIKKITNNNHEGMVTHSRSSSTNLPSSLSSNSVSNLPSSFQSTSISNLPSRPPPSLPSSLPSSFPSSLPSRPPPSLPSSLSSTSAKPFAITLPPGYWKRVTVPSRPFIPKQVKPDPLKGLLVCCQNQAPGCRQLCTKDVSKDEIKQALVSQQCPPLSMTSVISCFPHYYDTSSVSTCCANSKTLPKQCLALCAPDFKPTLAHLACIDHISTIVECYRDLMR